MRPVLITGVSSGIGRGIARVLTAAGIQVYGSVRREEDARSFEAEFGAKARAVVFDLRDEAVIRVAAALVAAETDGAGLAAIVNNAGFAAPGPLEAIPLAAFREQIEIGVTGVLAVTQAFLPLLRSRRGDAPGRIITISSVGGATAMPFLGPYAAAKFGLEALSDSLRRELAVHGIRVVVIQPGGIATPIWTKASAADVGAFAETPYAAPLAIFRRLALAAGAGGRPRPPHPPGEASEAALSDHAPPGDRADHASPSDAAPRPADRMAPRPPPPRQPMTGGCRFVSPPPSDGRRRQSHHREHGMNVGILGTSVVGKALGHGFATLGDLVKMGARDGKNEAALAFAKEHAPSATAGTFADAAAFADIVVIATKGNVLPEVVAAAGTRPFDGKVVIDATNPLDTAKGFPPGLTLSGNDSGGETLQRLLPNARVVKAFNIVGNAHMFRPKFEGGPPDMLIAGNDAEAKRTVTRILADFGWPRTIDLGGISSSRWLEAITMAGVMAGVALGKFDHAFKIVHAK